MYNEETLSALTRAELVSLAKKSGVRANQKTCVIVASLVALSASEKVVAVPSSQPKTPKQVDFRETQEEYSTPDLQDMTYNEIRSLAKATPGVKVSR